MENHDMRYMREETDKEQRKEALDIARYEENQLCPLTTIKGIVYCMDKYCQIRKVANCPPLIPEMNQFHQKL